MSYPNLEHFPPHDNFRSRLGRALGHPARFKLLRLAGRDLISFQEIHARMGMNRRTLSRHIQFLVQRRWLIPIQAGAKTWYGLDERRFLREVRRMQGFFREMRGLVEGASRPPGGDNIT